MGKRQHTGNKPDLEKRAEAVRLYQTGLSLRQVGLLMGITFQAVHSLLTRSGIPLRKRGGNQGAHSRRKK